MNDKIIDGMRKEGKPFRNIMFFWIYFCNNNAFVYLFNEQ